MATQANDHQHCLTTAPRAPKPLPVEPAEAGPGPVFSTTDRTLTSLLRLPPEIRLKIYRHLLVPTKDPAADYDDDDVNRLTCAICPATRRLVRYENSFASGHTFFRVSAAILRTCRLIHAEATEVFYGENTFTVSRCGSSGLVAADSWALSPRAISCITRLEVALIREKATVLYSPRVSDLRAAFPTLRLVRFGLNVTPKQWAAFLAEGAEDLAYVDRVEIDILPYTWGWGSRGRAGGASGKERRPAREEYREMCIRAAQEHAGKWKRGAVRIDFFFPMSFGTWHIERESWIS